MIEEQNFHQTVKNAQIQKKSLNKSLIMEIKLKRLLVLKKY